MVCKPKMPGEIIPSIPASRKPMPRIVATVFAMTLIFLLGKKRWTSERGDHTPDRVKSPLVM